MRSERAEQKAKGASFELTERRGRGRFYLKMKKHLLGRFIDNKQGSSFLRPIRRARHIRSQMTFFSRSTRRSVASGFGSSGGKVTFL